MLTFITTKLQNIFVQINDVFVSFKLFSTFLYPRQTLKHKKLNISKVLYIYTTILNQVGFEIKTTLTINKNMYDQTNVDYDVTQESTGWTC